MYSPKRLVIATRSSKLAFMQADYVKRALCLLYPDCIIELSAMKTRGDQVLDRAISEIGGNGIFVKELEEALLDKRADLAVHSLKDVPVNIKAPLEVCSILKRGDPRDAFISNKYSSLDQLPKGSIVGTSSLRRAAQIRAKYPLIIIKPLRGNIETRLKKLDNGHYTGIVLASIALKRLGLRERICDFLDFSDFLPAPGQGTLGIEIDGNETNLRSCLAPLNCKSTTACSKAERAVSRALSGSCKVPLAAHAEVIDQDELWLRLRVSISSVDGKNVIYGEKLGSVMHAEELGLEVAKNLLNQGAGLILREISEKTVTEFSHE